ncbi:MAG: DUF805 domain-containing protein, partial [Albidovulum sp.]
AWGEDLLTASDTLDWAILVLAVLVVCPYFAVSVRRFHDVGISGWYFLALSVAATGASFALDYVDVLKTSPSPDLNPLVTPALFEINAKAVALMGLSLLAYLAEIIICLWRGQPQANRYGPNPHEVTP